jgi:hypothetical protein
VSTVKFRHSSAIAIAALVAFFGAIPVATYRWFLTPILLVPLAVLVWGWRAGTDADDLGVSARALLGNRRLPWSRITALVPAGRRVVAVLDGGAAVRLPAVSPADLPKLIAASGAELDTGAEPATGSGDAATPGNAAAPGDADTDDAEVSTRPGPR